MTEPVLLCELYTKFNILLGVLSQLNYLIHLSCRGLSTKTFYIFLKRGIITGYNIDIISNSKLIEC
jgi:hypothetical protein